MTIAEPRQFQVEDMTLPGRTPPPPLHAARRAPAPARSRHRPGRRPLRWAPDLFLVIVGTGLGAVLGEVVTAESRGSLTAPGGLLIAGGRLAGFTGAYLMLVMVLLIARVPWLERAVGQDQLLRWHRRSAPWALGLITAHVVLITLGYAQSSRTGALRQLWVFLSSYPDMLAAAAGFALLAMVAVTSVRIARRRLRYETWWVVHLYTYIALSLAFAHQVATGASFVGHPLARAIWALAWASTAGLVVVYRVGLPVGRNLRHQLRIEWAREEAPGVYSIVLRGRKLDRLAVSGGQFFQWRFVAPGLWWQAHPYSLSAVPRPPFMRVTVKALGDHSRAIARLRPGTRVLVEGPYGAFTHHARSTSRVALIAAGVGVTPVRAMLEDLPAGVDVAVVLRASRREDLVHRDEIAALVEGRGGRAYAVLGPRHEVRFDARALARFVPDLALRDVYICGPADFAKTVVSAARRLGVPKERIHREAFAF
ncbi:MAG TPA: ferredoxin reductase family protein [Acidimicrobiales bacterium]|nr:ferredoxin reductase family protein [Acidimicrobiales bacterium]